MVADRKMRLGIRRINHVFLPVTKSLKPLLTTEFKKIRRYKPFKEGRSTRVKTELAILS